MYLITIDINSPVRSKELSRGEHCMGSFNHTTLAQVRCGQNYIYYIHSDMFFRTQARWKKFRNVAN